MTRQATDEEELDSKKEPVKLLHADEKETSLRCGGLQLDYSVSCGRVLFFHTITQGRSIHKKQQLLAGD